MFDLLPNGEYDVFASLGKKCQPAGRLKRCGLRNFSGPFDWFANQRLPEVHRILEKGVDHLFLMENIKVHGTHKDCLDIRDSATGLRSIHDIQICARDQLREQIDTLRGTIARRRKNLIQQLINADRALLIRLNAETTALKRLRTFLDKSFPNTQIDILTINEKAGMDIIATPACIPNTFIIAGDNSPSGETWLGNDNIWNTSLRNVRTR